MMLRSVQPSLRSVLGATLIGAGYLITVGWIEWSATGAWTIDDVDISGLWPGEVVTEVAPVGEFWEAEPEHQDYLVQYPNGYTCHYPRADWRLSRRTTASA